MPLQPVDRRYSSGALAAARERLASRANRAAGAGEQFRRPAERPFLASERDKVTILFGGLTATHERLIQAVFESCGHSSLPLPAADLDACQVGKQYCNNGVCNPAYFTIGSLIRYLQQLEASGMSRQDIIDRHVFFTAGSCGPCRFGMYESEYRLALRNAGFDGFRVLLFQQEHGVKADTGEPGLKLSLHLGLGAVNAFTFGDALQAFGYDVRPYETTPGLTDRRLRQSIEAVAAALARRQPAVVADRVPSWVLRVANPRHVEILLKIRDHLYGEPTADAIRACSIPLDDIDVDRLRVKPVVKVTGEFWAQTTEGDGNFRMFEFLEREGAHVLVEPIGGWLLYLVQYARVRLPQRRGLDLPRDGSVYRRLAGHARETRRVGGRMLLLEIAEWMHRQHYDRIRQSLAVSHPLLDQRELARLADPYYRQLARGGEGHLEVAKNIYYTTRNAAHMVLSLKPFGCMPSTQSDGVQSAILARFRDMLFLPVETGAEGELTAHSRVQMALVDARMRAETEFQRALATTGRRLDDIRRFVDDHPGLRRATYPVPHREGVAGAAATFVLHVNDLMRAGGRPFRWHVSRPAAHGGAR
jgi:predicted nucleotide-binding protein (sugar kinase/HSP70/actin superfamily)